MLNRWSDWGLLSAGFKRQCFTRHNSIIYAKINDHGGRPGDRVQILPRWWCPVVSSVTLDVRHRRMSTLLHRRTHMVIEMASEVGASFHIIKFIIYKLC